MKKLNICLISLTIFPDNLSGASRVVRSLFEYLRNKGHNVKLLTGKWQQIVHIEFDHRPRSRNIVITVYGEDH